VGFLERDFDHDHLAEKSNWTKMGQKIHFILQNLLDRPHCATIQAALSAVALQPLRNVNLIILPVLTREHYTSLLHWV
jgi:hypothetical protein